MARGPGPAQVFVWEIQDTLVVGIRVDGNHHAPFNPEGLMEDQGGRGQTIGGAGGIGNDLMVFRLVLILVYPHHHGQIDFLGRGGNDHLFGPGLQMGLGLGTGGKQAGTLDHHFHADIVPGNGGGILRRRNLSLAAR